MPTLADAALGRVSGASLVPSLDVALGTLLQTFGTKQEREEAEAEKRKETEREVGIQKQIDILASGSLDPQAEEAALLRLGAIDPALANATRATLVSGNQQEIGVLKQVTEQGARDSVFVSSQPNFASKQAAIGQLASAAAARGEPMDRFIQLQNMSEPELDLELQRMQIAAQDIGTLLKPLEAAKPTTAIGKARQDLNLGLITQADFDAITKTPTEFQTDVGKLIGDRQLVLDMFGEGSQQLAAIDEAISSDQKGEAPKLSDVAGVRKEFTKLSDDFIKLRDAIGKVEQSNLNPSPAGDLALIFNFMKIQDPGSVVRESEFETAQNATNLPGRLGAAAQRVVSGERMLPEQRQDFVDTANRLFEAQKGRQRQLENSFRGIAESQNMKPEDVVIDFIGGEQPIVEEVITAGPQEGATATNPATGEVLVFRNGQWQTP